MEKHLLVAVPSYTPQVHWETSQSIHAASLMLNRMGCKTSVVYFTGLADIGRARNALFASFVGRKEFSDLLFVDADVSWSPGTMERLVGHPVDLVFGAYPVKCDGPKFPISGFDHQRSSVRCVDPLTGEDADKGLVEVQGGPGGFMRITRQCAEQMIEHYADLWYEDEYCPDDKAWALFEFAVCDHRRIGEDLEFCRKWRAMGGKAWLDPWLTFRHHGVKTWSGCIAEYWASVQERAAVVMQKNSAA